VAQVDARLPLFMEQANRFRSDTDCKVNPNLTASVSGV
jgi:hypothetical protein